jgi:hypothetical protein
MSYRKRSVLGRVAGTVLAGAAGLAFAAGEPSPSPSPADSPPAAASSIEAGLVVVQASADARYLGQWIQARQDHGGQPFAIVDKKEARLYVFDDRQTLVGSSTVLTGATVGDDSAPGIGQRAQSQRVARDERTTPAGRFASEPGHNRTGEDIVWFDYGAALAIHRLRQDAAYAQRQQRLQTPSPDDNRASLGCVVVPVAFYERVVRPWLGSRRGVVYVLPDSRPVQALWPSESMRLARQD